MAKIGRYETPSLTVNWSRPPAEGTHCEPFQLETRFETEVADQVPGHHRVGRVRVVVALE